MPVATLQVSIISCIGAFIEGISSFMLMSSAITSGWEYHCVSAGQCR